MSATVDQQPVWSAALTHPAAVLTAPLLPLQALARDRQYVGTQSIIYTTGTTGITGPSKGRLVILYTQLLIGRADPLDRRYGR